MMYVPAINWNSLPSEKYIRIENRMHSVMVLPI